MQKETESFIYRSDIIAIWKRGSQAKDSNYF